ncbi:MAG: hypothetical protein GQ544_06340 [Candidatus Aminicenantes bacterium]|nr:hypothetical protein [Candidatus Aminicenantes bacterium]
MQKNQIISVLLFTLILIAGTASLKAAQTEVPKAELPVLLTSCGQSPGANMLKAIFMRLKLPNETKAYELVTSATPDDLKAAQEAGFPYKTMIIVMGASLKGMGAAGISMDDELDRAAQLIEAARAQGITIIGSHIEGMKRRAQGANPGDNTDELSIDAIAPKSDFLIIRKDGNEDGRFSVIAKEKNIPLLEVEKNMELFEVLRQIFSK